MWFNKHIKTNNQCRNHETKKDYYRLIAYSLESKNKFDFRPRKDNYNKKQRKMYHSYKNRV